MVLLAKLGMTISLPLTTIEAVEKATQLSTTGY
jgi:hypothetical protein